MLKKEISGERHLTSCPEDEYDNHGTHSELTGDIVPPARMTDRAESTTSWKVVDGLRRRYFISISSFSLLSILENMMRPSIALNEYAIPNHLCIGSPSLAPVRPSMNPSTN